MRILITGATGFVGRHLVSRLESKNHDIHCLVRKTSDCRSLSERRINFLYGDVTDYESLKKAVVGMDYIYHLAIAKQPKNIETIYAINTIGTDNLIKACWENNDKLQKFIFVSSSAASGFSPSEKLLNETDPAYPVTHYGKSKLKAENIVNQYKDRLPVIILRPPTIYGYGNLFLRYILNILMKGIKPIWNGYTNLCYIDDFIDGLILAGKNKNSTGQTYFIHDGNRYSWKDVINIMDKLLGGNAHTIYLPSPFIHLAAFVLPPLSRLIHKPSIGNKIIELKYPYGISDCSKIQRELNFRCHFDLKKGLTETTRFFKSAKGMN